MHQLVRLPTAYKHQRRRGRRRGTGAGERRTNNMVEDMQKKDSSVADFLNALQAFHKLIRNKMD